MKIKLNYLSVLVVFLLLQFGSEEKPVNEDFGDEINQSKQITKKPVRYFSSLSDKVMISVTEQTIYTNNPVTTLTYYAVDNSNKSVQFRENDRAFVRILGITRLFTNNVEIFHPQKPDGSKDYALFSGDITFPREGIYLVKVCLGKSINLDSEGNKVWPFGCFEDQTSAQVNVYEKN